MVDRQRVKNKFDGRCAYCGCPLPSRWEIDHVIPLWRKCEDNHKVVIDNGDGTVTITTAGKVRGEDIESNMFPACKRCNTHKSMMSIEQFRQYIRDSYDKVLKANRRFKLGMDYGVIERGDKPIEFYFEKWQREHDVILYVPIKVEGETISWEEYKKRCEIEILEDYNKARGRHLTYEEFYSDEPITLDLSFLDKYDEGNKKGTMGPSGA